jgi:DNA-binding response OmpR family regulator
MHAQNREHQRSYVDPVHVLHIERAYLSRCTKLPMCLLLDLTLPDGDGLEVCDEIKLSPVFQRLPIVILSGRSVTSSECLKHKAIYRVAKDVNAENELSELLQSILDQSERSRGVVDAGDLRLDPRGFWISHGGEPIAVLQRGPFSALLTLVQSAPRPVSEKRLYEAFLERAPHNKSDPDLSIHITVRNYVSRLRGVLGDPIAARIAFVHDEGYVYRVPKP